MATAVKPNWRVEFGGRIRASRKSHGWTQERLADESGMHPTYVGDAERGERNVSLDGILILAKVLKVRPGELLDGLEKSVKIRRRAP